MNHRHEEYCHRDGLFTCLCGAVRIEVGVWADKQTSAKMRREAKRETARLKTKHGTAVDAYGRRLA